MVGVLGGMGPMATADFYKKLIELTPAKKDQEHLPVFIYGDPSVPDRADSILGNQEETVFAALTKGIRMLERVGVEVTVIPCNTAHHWLDRLKKISEHEILSIVDASIAFARERAPSVKCATVLGTRGTIRAKIYDNKLEQAGYIVRTLDDELQNVVTEVISCVKAGEAPCAAEKFQALFTRIKHDADVFFLACTELPIAAHDLLEQNPGLIDTTKALAWYTVSWFQQQRLDTK